MNVMPMGSVRIIQEVMIGIASQDTLVMVSHVLTSTNVITILVIVMPCVPMYLVHFLVNVISAIMGMALNVLTSTSVSLILALQQAEYALIQTARSIAHVTLASTVMDSCVRTQMNVRTRQRAMKMQRAPIQLDHTAVLVTLVSVATVKLVLMSMNVKMITPVRIMELVRTLLVAINVPVTVGMTVMDSTVLTSMSVTPLPVMSMHCAKILSALSNVHVTLVILETDSVVKT